MAHSIMPVQWEAVRTEAEAISCLKKSPFYNKASNNESSSIPLNDAGVEVLLGLTGPEFMVDRVASSPPDLWVVRYQIRRSRTDATLSRLFYILYGTIYQVPSLDVFLAY